MAQWLYEVSSRCSNKNFTIKGDKAYTEDEVLVFNIFVYSIPKKITLEDLQLYFSQFGEIRGVRMADKKKNRRSVSKLGFVNFVEASSAVKVLKKQCHNLRGHRIRVKAGDSWNQPHADETCGADDSSSTCSGDNIDYGNRDILLLNDDCLEHICQFLELSDQIRFARVCTRFRFVFQMFCKRVYKIVDLNVMNYMTLWEIRDFFRFAGECIEKVTGTIQYENRDRIVEFMRRNCKNMKQLSVDNCRMRGEVLRKLVGNMTFLKELCLDDCSLNDQSVLALSQITNLDVLILSNNFGLSGRYLKNFQHLKSLNLYGCINMQNAYFIETCKMVKGLKSLDIRRCDGLTAFDIMIEHCLQLEVLKMSCTDHVYGRVAQLPSLKELQLLRCTYPLGTGINTHIFKELVKYKSNQLERFKIVAKDMLTTERIELISQLKKLQTLFLAFNQSLNDDALRQLSNLEELEEIVLRNCPNVTNAGILSLLRNCTRLRFINVQYCKNVKLELITKAIKLLEPRRSTMKTPVLLMVYGTSITEDALSLVPEYNADTKATLLNVDFGEFSTDGHQMCKYDLLDGEEILDEDFDYDDLADDYDFEYDYDYDSDEDREYFLPSDDDDDISLAFVNVLVAHGMEFDDLD